MEPIPSTIKLHSKRFLLNSVVAGALKQNSFVHFGKLISKEKIVENTKLTRHTFFLIIYSRVQCLRLSLFLFLCRVTSVSTIMID